MEFEKYRLSQLLTIKNGRDYKSLGQGSVPVFGSGGYMCSVDSYLYDRPSVLLPRKGTLSNIQYYNKGPFWTVDTCYYTIVNENLVDSYYVYRYLRNLNLSGLDTGASIPSMTQKTYNGIKILLPNLSIQHRIASILSTYDTLIENNTKRIRLLEKMAENLYKEWFVRFRFPGHENVEKENGLPKGWKYVNFSNLSPILTGKKDANYASQNGKYKFFTCSKNDLVADNYSFDCFAIILAGNGDLNVKLYDGQFEAYQRTYVLSPYDVEHIYVSYYTIQSELDRLLVGAAGAVIKFLTKGMIEKIKVLLPTNDVLVRFNSIQEHNYRLRQNLKRQNSLLARQRDLLLPRLMSGKLEVKEELLE